MIQEETEAGVYRGLFRVKRVRSYGPSLADQLRGARNPEELDEVAGRIVALFEKGTISRGTARKLDRVYRERKGHLSLVILPPKLTLENGGRGGVLVKDQGGDPSQG